MEKKTIWDLDRVDIEHFKAQAKTPVVLVLDNVRSLNNIGSMFRTADAFALTGLCLCGITATPPSPEIHKTALGAEESMDWRHWDSTAHCLRELKALGYTLCCLEQVKGSVSLEKFRPRAGERYAIIVGHEVDGVSQEAVDLSDVCLEIPQRGTKHSLNVAVSAGLAIWHFFSGMEL